MRIVIAGGHGQGGLRLGRLLAERRHQAVGPVRNPDHDADLRTSGVEPVVLDPEHAPTQDVAHALSDTGAVVFAAGAVHRGPLRLPLRRVAPLAAQQLVPARPPGGLTA